MGRQLGGPPKVSLPLLEEAPFSYHLPPRQVLQLWAILITLP